MNDTPNNVVKFPMTRAMRLRHAVNKTKEALFEPEQADYKPTPDPVAGALDDHLRAAQSTEEYQAILPRPEHFEQGQQEAKIISMGKFKEDKANKELMENNNE
jgi:hypothetical protein